MVYTDDNGLQVNCVSVDAKSDAALLASEVTPPRSSPSIPNNAQDILYLGERPDRQRKRLKRIHNKTDDRIELTDEELKVRHNFNFILSLS
jgi:hypothetical protein